MRLAVLTHPVGAGGISRVVGRLVEALAQNDPALSVTLFCGRTFTTRDDLTALAARTPNLSLALLEELGVRAMDVDSTVNPPARRSWVQRLRSVAKRSDVLTRAYVATRRRSGASSLPWYYFRFPREVLASLAEHDVVYLVSAAFVEPFDVGRPVVCTLHDFNWKHGFRGNFTREMECLLDSQIAAWMERYTTLVFDSEFIRSELPLFFPHSHPATRVIRLAPFARGGVSDEKLLETLDRLQLPRDYVLFPGSIARHKNTANLLRAWDILRRDHRQPIPLVISGMGSNLLRSSSSSPLTADAPLSEILSALEGSGLVVGRDLHCLGYVSDSEIDALIAGARLIVSPSYYEGSAGPALDGWAAGRPVAFSRIPTFVEHLETLGTHAWLFDPDSPADIAATVHTALERRDESESMARASQEAVARRSWSDVAREYASLFAEAARGAP